MLKKFAAALTVALAINVMTPAIAADYLGNTKSMKFHFYNCRTIKHPDAPHFVSFNSRAEAVNAGYSPCGVCKP